MCLYPQRLDNRKYKPNKKNNGNVPSLPVVSRDLQYDLQIIEGEPKWIKKMNTYYDERVLEIMAPCGRCVECCAAKAREWQVRLSEEKKEWKYKYFVTFTFSPKGLREIVLKHKIGEDNAAAAFALRHSLERYRKDHKKSYRHWFITELGHEGTERIHMHGIIFFNEPQEFEKIKEVEGKGWMCKWKYWKYGHIFVGDYVSQKSISYVVKYMEKIDTDHKNFVGQVLCSPGIGKNWLDKLEQLNDNTYKYKPRQTKDYYRLENGCKVKLPKYYANKLLNEEEREKKWREFMDTHKVTIAGNTYSEKIGNKILANITEKAQEVNMKLGYGNNSKEWRKAEHNITRRMMALAEKDPNKKEEMEILRRKSYKKAKKMLENLEISR